MAWEDDSIQALLEEILDGITIITIGREEYEGAPVRQGKPQFQDTDLPLSVPVISITPLSINHLPVAFNDQIRTDTQGMDVEGWYMLSVWTSRGLPHTPVSGSGGVNTANRIIGLLMNDINLDASLVPESIQNWMLQEAPSGSRTGEAEYDETRDLYEAQALLYVEGEVHRRSGTDAC